MISFLNFSSHQAVTAGLILLINVFAKGQDGPMLTSSAMMDVQKCVAVLEELKGRYVCFVTVHLASADDVFAPERSLLVSVTVD